MATHQKNGLQRTASALRYFAKGANKSHLTSGECNRLSNIKASYRNAREEGHIGGASGIEPSHFDHSAEWLEAMIERYGLALPTFGPDGWPMPENR